MAEPRRPWHRSIRFWVSLVTAGAVGLIVWGAWPTILEAAASLADVTPWILALLLPCQLLSFALTGEVLFSFLRARGELKGMHPLAGVRMSLEFNFANHMLPSGGAAGIAYTTWKLGTLGVPASRGTIGQLARFGVTFVSFSVLLAVAAASLAIAGTGSAAVYGIAGAVGGLAVVATVAGVLLLRRRRMLHRFAGFVVGAVNRAARIARVKRRLPLIPVIRFLDGAHVEVREITRDPRALVVPFLLSFGVNAADAGLFVIALLAFDLPADPALIFVAYGIATVASMIIVTPNGVGAYEVVLIATLVAGGLVAGPTTAAIVMARTILLIGTIVFGWGFYQHSVATAGAPPVRRGATPLPDGR